MNGGQGMNPAHLFYLIMRRNRRTFGHGFRNPVRELADHHHVAPEVILYRRNCEQAGVEFSALLSRISPDVVEIHRRKAAVAAGLDMDLEVLITHRSDIAAAVMEHIIATAMPLAEQ